MMKALVIVFLLGIIIPNIQNVKILGVFTSVSKSHYFLSSSLMNALGEKGHNVTMISLFKTENPAYRQIVLEKWFKTIKKYLDNMDFFQHGSSNPFLSQFTLFKNLHILYQDIMNDTKIQKLINSNEQFDVVIVEQYFNEAQNGLANHFNASLVAFTTMGPSHRVNYLVGNPSPVSYIPEYFLTYSSEMTYFQRLSNTFTHFLINIFKTLYLLPKQEVILKKYLPNSPNLYDILYNTSLVLLNSHHSFSQAVPLVPNMIEIGGFHLKPPKQLSEDLQEYLDSSKDGVIYFSMGSNAQSSKLPLEKREELLKAFATLSQKILWKWENDEFPGKPKNVKLVKWLPQHSILAHPNIKLFITHGGLLSIIETIYHGVPTLIIPIFSDQKTNAARAVSDGYALKLDYSQLTEKELIRKINELLYNRKYRNMAQFRSNIFHDQEVKPIDRAIYWIEYIARNKGADHLKITGRNFHWYKYHLLDIILFVFLIIINTSVLLFLLIKRLSFR